MPPLTKAKRAQHSPDQPPSSDVLFASSIARQALRSTKKPPSETRKGREKISQICSLTGNVLPSSNTPLQYLDHVSLITTRVLTESLPPPQRLPSPIVFDKLVHLPFLCHDGKILLAVNKSGPTKGWKPLTQTYTLDSSSTCLDRLGSSTVEDVFEKTLFDLLGLRVQKDGQRGQICRSLAEPVLSPRFGEYRVYEKVDSWYLGLLYEFTADVVLKLNNEDKMEVDGEDVCPLTFPLPPDSTVLGYKWWKWDKVKESKEIDFFTKGLVGEAFKSMKAGEQKLDRIMAGPEV